jgi:hypothetical protein
MCGVYRPRNRSCTWVLKRRRSLTPDRDSSLTAVSEGRFAPADRLEHACRPRRSLLAVMLTPCRTRRGVKWTSEYLASMRDLRRAAWL